jgi:hypothetical protein
MYQHISRDVPAWDIQIEKSHLQEWPENGNILDVVKTVNTKTVIDSPAGDEDVLGPDPLQNIEDPDEVFIGTELPNDFANNIEVVGDKAKMQQKDVLPIGIFARMEDTPYAWALAFPTLFPPTFRKNKWVILGDSTLPPSSGFRDRKVPLAEWVKWMMWTSNGQAAKHPFFALVLNSELTRKGLQSQGRVTLSCNDIPPPDMTIEAFRKHWNTPKGQQSIHNALNFGARNTRGMSQYWANANRQFKVSAFFHDYVNQLPMRYFHTLSQAEFHNPFLCNCLSTYASQVGSEEYGRKILKHDAVCHKVIGDYKKML